MCKCKYQLEAEYWNWFCNICEHEKDREGVELSVQNTIATLRNCIEEGKNMKGKPTSYHGMKYLDIISSKNTEYIKELDLIKHELLKEAPDITRNAIKVVADKIKDGNYNAAWNWIKMISGSDTIKILVNESNTKQAQEVTSEEAEKIIKEAHNLLSGNIIDISDEK